MSVINARGDALTIKHLSIRQQDNVLIEVPELRIAPGQVATLVGPSGSGKSTLLRWILGEPLTDFRIAGELWLGQERIDQKPIEQRQIGLMYQKGDLFPHLTVRQNLLFALPRVGKAEQHQRADQALQAVGLADKGDAMPDELSGGEQSRIALIRSLLAEPRAILLDEPFSALDTQLRRQIREWTFAQIQQRHIPAVLVTHDPADQGQGPLIELEATHV